MEEEKKINQVNARLTKIHKGKMYFNISIHLDLCSKTSVKEQGKTKQNRILKRGLITFRSLD